LAHGSRRPGVGASIEGLLIATAELGGLQTRAAYLDLIAPDLGTVCADLPAGSGAVVVPLLFTRAFHATVDVPATLREAAERTGTDLVLADILGTGDDIAEIALASAAGAGIADDQPVLLYSVGSSDATANEAVHDLAARLGRRRQGRVAAGFGTAAPYGRDVLAELGQDGVPAILPLFVSPGVLLDPLIELAAERDWTIAGPLESRLAPVVVARARDAWATHSTVG
jgi:sirohydrochlorin cobaltochelatase